jgi:Zn-dependent protease
MNKLIQWLLLVPGAVLAFTIHEFAHALLAVKLGDPSPKEDGRLTLNPLRHLDPIGFLMILIFRFGWAKPVRYNPANFKKPVEHSILVALAGPLMNLASGFIILLVLKFVLPLLRGAAGAYAVTVLANAAWINLALFIFNLLPLPPLDGSYLVLHSIPDRFFRFKLGYARYGSFVLVGLLLVSSLFQVDILPITRLTQNLFDILRRIFAF